MTSETDLIYEQGLVLWRAGKKDPPQPLSLHLGTLMMLVATNSERDPNFPSEVVAAAFDVAVEWATVTGAREIEGSDHGNEDASGIG